MKFLMNKFRNTYGYISIEIVIVIAIILIGGTIGVSKYSAKGKETTSKTNNTVAKVYKDYGNVDISLTGNGKNDSSNSGNNEVKTDGINYFDDADNIQLTGSDFYERVSLKNNKTIVLDDGEFNSHTSPYFKDLSTSEFSKKYKGSSFKFSADIKTKNLKHDGLFLHFDVAETLTLRSYANPHQLDIPIKASNDGEWTNLSGIFYVDDKIANSSLISIIGWYKDSAPFDYKGVEIEYKNFKLEKVVQ